MGREYFGDINGKFGFAVQSSSDLENLIKINYEQDYEWYVCNCSLDIDDVGKKKYCLCFSSYDEHFKEALNEDEDLEEGDDLYMESSTISYHIYKEDHYVNLIKNLAKIKLKLPNDVVEEFKKIEYNDMIVDGYSNIYDTCCNKINQYNDKKLSELYCRYKLGLQVKYVLEKQDHCFLNCET